MKGQVPNMGIYAPWWINAMHPYLKRLSFLSIGKGDGGAHHYLTQGPGWMLSAGLCLQPAGSVCCAVPTSMLSTGLCLQPAGSVLVGSPVRCSPLDSVYSLLVQFVVESPVR